MKLTSSYQFIAQLTVAIAAVGCADLSISDDEDLVCNDGSTITFNVSVDKDNSRGEVLTLSTLSQFEVSARMGNSTVMQPYFSHEKYSFSPSDKTIGTSVQGNVYYWLDDYQIYDFYACAPAGVVDFEEESSTSFSYTVDSIVQNQIDVLSCVVAGATKGKPVGLNFEHVLSCISIECAGAPSDSKIISIEIGGVKGQGTYAMATGQWTLTGKTSCSYILNCDEELETGISITGAKGNFFLLPQQLTDSAYVKAIWTDANGDSIQSISSITGAWTKGQSYNYKVNIKPDYNIDITNAAIVQDAPYVIVKDGAVTLKINGASDNNLKLTATASDSANVTLQLESQLNEYAKLGFWTDQTLDNNGNITGSARGTKTISGLTNGSYSIAVFLPENLSNDTIRIITLDLTDGNKVLATAQIKQLPPAWSNGCGWQQIEDSSTCAFGFDWTRNVYLAYRGPETLDLSASDLYLKSLIDMFEADNYASVGKYLKHNLDGTSQYRAYIDLDYADVTDLENLTLSDGFLNTSTLNQEGGSAATGTFELALMSMRKTEGSAATDAFYIPTVARDGAHAPTSVLTQVSGDGALAQVLKKNSYNLVEMNPAANGQTGYACILEKLRWYLPSVDEFSSLPTTIVDEIHPMLCWSSTASGSIYAYSGHGALIHRTSQLKVRACRSWLR